MTPLVVTAPPIATPVATTAPTAGPLELEVDDLALQAGTYTRTGFEPAITLGLDGAWWAVVVEDSVLWLRHGPDAPDVVTVQILRPDWAYAPGAIAVQDLDAQLVVDTIQANDLLVEIESSTSRIGGLEGLEITVENPTKDDAWILHAPIGDLKVPAGHRSWMAFFDTPDGVVAILVGGPISGWDAALALAEPLLESIRFSVR
ncbi:MAG: hypothetical protein ABIZ52_08850 [Candidatus Limnocylindrales bacterium]